MDLSKLPKLSETPPPPAPPVESASNQEELSDHRRVDPSEMIGAEVWLSAIIGLIFLLLGRRFAIYLFSVVSGKAFHTGVNWISGAKAGQEVGYRELEGFVFFNESAMFAFGLALIFEAIVLAVLNLNIPGKRPGNNLQSDRRPAALHDRGAAAVFAFGGCLWWIYRGAGVADAANAAARNSSASRIKMPRMRGRSSGAQGGRGLWNRPLCHLRPGALANLLRCCLIGCSDN